MSLPWPADAYAAVSVIFSVAAGVLALPGEIELGVLLYAVPEDDFVDALRAAGATFVPLRGPRGGAANELHLLRMVKAGRLVVTLIDGIELVDDPQASCAERDRRLRTVFPTDVYLNIFDMFRRYARVARSKGDIRHPIHVMPRIWAHLSSAQHLELARRGLLPAATAYAVRVVESQDVAESDERASSSGRRS